MGKKRGREEVRVGLVLVLVWGVWGMSGESEAQWGSCGYCVEPSPGAIPREGDERASGRGWDSGDWLSEQVERDWERAARWAEWGERERRHREQMEALRYPNGGMPKWCGGYTLDEGSGLWVGGMTPADRDGGCR